MRNTPLTPTDDQRLLVHHAPHIGGGQHYGDLGYTRLEHRRISRRADQHRVNLSKDLVVLGHKITHQCVRVDPQAIDPRPVARIDVLTQSGIRYPAWTAC